MSLVRRETAGATTFVTGATGFLGGYALRELLAHTDARFLVLVRGKSEADAQAKLWRSMELHLDAASFERALERIECVLGDLTAPNLGLDEGRWNDVGRRLDSVLHIAASLNRKSERACLNTNLRGSLSVIRLARVAATRGRLRRYTHVSTVAVAGERDREVVREDAAVDWDRRDYDPYGRTKKFAEHMARELLPAEALLFLRPSIVMGDSTRPETTQFDMVRSFCMLADLPFVPMRPDARLDIVPANFVGAAIAKLHDKATLDHDTYHLAAGEGSERAAEIARAIGEGMGRRPPRFVPALAGTFEAAIAAANRWPRRDAVQLAGSLLKVFWPYITYDTVFDNTRVVAETGLRPAPFTSYCVPLYRWSKAHGFRYPHTSWPAPRARARGDGAPEVLAERRDQPAEPLRVRP